MPTLPGWEACMSPFPIPKLPFPSPGAFLDELGALSGGGGQACCACPLGQRPCLVGTAGRCASSSSQLVQFLLLV